MVVNACVVALAKFWPDGSLTPPHPGALTVGG